MCAPAPCSRVSLLLASYSPRSVSRVVLASRTQEGKTPADLARQYKESKWEEVSRPAGTREGADGSHTPHHSLTEQVITILEAEEKAMAEKPREPKPWAKAASGGLRMPAGMS